MPNRLSHEKSPYLLQHAENPVDWFSWGSEAFEKARAEQKPIFLSIGYSTCHWCHVMAHESFENESVAALLNEHFVSVKVDREERPDVDRVYMSYVQALTGHGGWPLSAWLTPDLKPFFGGTYFPPEDRHGRAGFKSLLGALAEAWANQREELVAESTRVIEVLRGHFGAPPEGTMRGKEQHFVDEADAALGKAFQYFRESFDARDGGFGGAPKFPRASNLEFLSRVVEIQGLDSEPGQEALRMVEVTLQKMAQGGIHDHVGGGFHRYSVDGEWFVPHFEKMLYDQALITLNFLDAYRLTRKPAYAWVARGVLDYVRRELLSPEGGFYSAEDADSLLEHGKSDHSEGAYYVWTRAEIERVLEDDTEFFCAHFGVKEKGNVESAQDPHEEFRGKSILRQVRPLAESARAAKLDLEEANAKLLASLEKLRQHRTKRPKPHLDDKVITAWNGLMISAYARGSQILGDGAALDLARRAAEFIERELYDEATGALYRSFRGGRSAVHAFAEDYAFLVQGLLDLYEACFDVKWLRWALCLQESMDKRFWDEERGGYFNSEEGDETIVLRMKEDYDGAEPAPSSIAALNLFRLAPVSGDEPGWQQRAVRTIMAFQPQWSRTPHAMPQMLCALAVVLQPPAHVVLAGDPASPSFEALAAAVRDSAVRPFVFTADGGDGQRWLGEQAPWMAEMSADGQAQAYVCENHACQRPTAEPEELRALLLGEARLTE